MAGHPAGFLKRGVLPWIFQAGVTAYGQNVAGNLGSGLRVCAVGFAACVLGAGGAVGDFTYVGWFKRVRHTSFGKMDTRLYTPLCTALGLGCLWLVSGRFAFGQWLG